MDCLEEFFKCTSFDSHNKYRCPSCKRESEATISTRVKMLPRVLIVHMKRFTNYATKMKNALEFPEELSLDKEWLAVNEKGQSKSISAHDLERERSHVYRLYAFIVHEGYSTQSGHYYSFVKHEEKWYRYDDDQVRCVGDLSSVHKQTKQAYLLFYQKFYSKATCATASPRYYAELRANLGRFAESDSDSDLNASPR